MFGSEKFLLDSAGGNGSNENDGMMFEGNYLGSPPSS